MFERHASNLDAALQADSTDYITSIQPSTSAVNHITLTDLYVSQNIFIPIFLLQPDFLIFGHGIRL